MNFSYPEKTGNKYFDDIIESEITITKVKDGEVVNEVSKDVEIGSGGPSSDVEYINKTTEEVTDEDNTEMNLPPIKLRKMEDDNTNISTVDENDTVNDVSEDTVEELPDDTITEIIDNPELLARLDSISNQIKDYLVDGNEAINFKANGSLVKELDQMFEHLINLSTKLNQEDLQKGTEKAYSTIISMYKYLSGKLNEILMKHLYMTVTRLYTDHEETPKGRNGYVFHPTMNIGMTFNYLQNGALSEKYNDLKIGKYLDALKDRDETNMPGPVAISQELLESYSVDSDGILIDAKKANNNKPIEIYLSLDVIGMFFSKYYMTDITTAKAITFTKEELTAIILHEIGHVIVMIENALSQVGLCNAFNDHLNKAIESKDIKALQEMKRITGAILKKTTSDTVKENIDAVEQASRILISDNSVEESEKNSSFVSSTLLLFKRTFLALIVPFIVYDFRVLLSTINWVRLITSGKFFSDILGGIKDHLFSKTLDTGKEDITQKGLSLNDLEIKVDKYVVRQGRGAELASALTKLDKVLSEGKDNSKMIYANRTFNRSKKIVNALSNLITLSRATFPSKRNRRVLLSFEDTNIRVKAILTELYGFFKQADLPADIKSHFLLQVDLAQKSINNSVDKFSQTRREFLKLAHVLRRVGDMNKFIFTFSQSSPRDYEKLLKSIEEGDNNSLYYFASLLEENKNKM